MSAPQSLPASPGAADFLADVRAGLLRAGQKSLSPKYFYDQLGSHLFEAITQLPEYGLWRAERALLTAHAGEIAALTHAIDVIELGSGSAAKTAVLLQPLLRHKPVRYCAIDVSRTALEMTRQELSVLAGLRLHTVEGDYFSGLEAAMRARPTHGATLVLMLGSSLGNFDFGASVRLLRHVRAALHPGDHLLLGADLMKPEPQMLAAYDDALGVTAAFNLNLLLRMNRELGANFVLSRFRHRVRFNGETHDVEMHLESLVEQTVHFAAGDFAVAFAAGETLHTENSHKYSAIELDRLADTCGFRPVAHWLDTSRLFLSALELAV
jgi:L-histidine N-alpha-methyltransferase